MLRQTPDRALKIRTVRPKPGRLVTLRGLKTEQLLQKLVEEGGIEVTEEEAQKFRGK